MAVRKLANTNAPVDMSAIIANAVAQALAAQATATMPAPAKPKAEPATWASAEAGVKIAEDGKSYAGVWFTDSRGGRMFMGTRKLTAVLAFVEIARKAVA